MVIAVLFFLMACFAGGRLSVWLTARPGRMAAVTAVTLIVAGVFTVLYWGVRLLARRGIIPWYPVAPWAAWQRRAPECRDRGRGVRTSGDAVIRAVGRR
ncbi:hypothetical protein J7E90_20990 [Streptomyces sp. ISL-111]|uniref:hypothetical protein n=1 Tax=unclassified Streptomyces TaxID=2593676 RepID=UPI000938A937|nr:MULTISPECIES: hypothetical protein [unclassified Streptomyces]MBT2379744.1 hypothetical protein [Streptomyces sp. ISL-111]